MNYKKGIENFVVDGYKNVHTTFETDGKHDFVLRNKVENFITPPQNLEYHRWAGSLKSSQALAYNIFSGIKNREFEFKMDVFDRPAQIDVKIKDVKTQTIELFEVKMFEVTNVSKKKIEFKESYFTKAKYTKRPDIADSFISFLHTVINHFEKEGRKIYGSGIKQLCSHLLGILNVMNDEEYENKKFKLYSLCFDIAFSDNFGQYIDNYAKTVTAFKRLVDVFLKEIKVDSRVEYSGYLSTSEYVIGNKNIIGKENYDYMMKRYLYLL